MTNDIEKEVENILSNYLNKHAEIIECEECAGDGYVVDYSKPAEAFVSGLPEVVCKNCQGGYTYPFGLKESTASIMGLVEREKKLSAMIAGQTALDLGVTDYISREEVERDYVHRSKIGIQEAVIECDTVEEFNGLMATKGYISKEEVAREYVKKDELEVFNLAMTCIRNVFDKSDYISKSDHEKALAEQKAKIEAEVREKTIEEISGTELTKEWEDGFYESKWKCDTLVYTPTEQNIINELTTFLPRHMPCYDWNLPYADEIILVLRRHIASLKSQPAMKLFTAEEAYELAVKHLPNIDVNKLSRAWNEGEVSFLDLITSFRIDIIKALKQAFGVKE